jgi:hypothetical protein
MTVSQEQVARLIKAATERMPVGDDGHPNEREVTDLVNRALTRRLIATLHAETTPPGTSRPAFDQAPEDRSGWDTWVERFLDDALGRAQSPGP